MSEGLVNAAYLGAAILFILALSGLSSNDNARRGNLYGMLGMALAVFATIMSAAVTNYTVIVGCIIVGGIIGLVLARHIKMTQMPQLVAVLHSMVGMAAVLVGYASYMDPSVTFVGVEKNHSRG